MLQTNLYAFSQEERQNPISTNEIMHSTMIGAGYSNILDSYLSPYNFSGTDIRMQFESMRHLKKWEGRVIHQVNTDINGAINSNHTGNRDEYAGGIRYTHGWFYNICPDGSIFNPESQKGSHLHIALGMQGSAYLGAIYINRSGNNPSQAKAQISANVSGIISYRIDFTDKFSTLLRYQISVPILGCAFSPYYGQSYFEIFGLGNYGRNVVFSHPFNAPTMCHNFTIDLPLRTFTLRVGVDAQFHQSTFNKIKYHNYSIDGMFGFAKYIYRK